MKCRVVKTKNGVMVIYPAPKSRLPGESEEVWYARIMEKDTPKGAVYEDIDSSELPPRDERDAWEFDTATKKVKINKVKAQKIKEEKLIREEKAKILEEQARQSLKDKGLL